MTILIHTAPTDSHAMAVHAALEAAGHAVCPLFLVGFPHQLTFSLHSAGARTTSTQFGALRERLDAQAISAVWHRRLRAVQAASAVIAESHRADVDRSVGEFFRCAVPSFSQGAFWVNDYAAARAATAKLVQLQAATTVGFKVPRTLASNDPGEIRDFISACAPGAAIYKPFAAGEWHARGTVAAAFTSVVTCDDLPDDALLQACPGLFQECIQKLFEVRVLVMGAHVVAVKIESGNEVDWRIAFYRKSAPFRPYALPAQVSAMCVRLVRALGLVFGCIDLACNTDGDYIFFENNEAGQFLWMEEYVPEQPVLAPFVAFLLARDAAFTWQARDSRVSLRSVLSSAGYARVEQRYLRCAAELRP